MKFDSRSWSLDTTLRIRAALVMRAAYHFRARIVVAMLHYKNSSDVQTWYDSASSHHL